jgi:glycosyltransferase involved in cell wall biosynthesis
MNNPKISVVFPVFNAEAYLEESITSILDQSFKDFELILIEDGSKDGSKKILKEFKKRDKRVILLENSSNLGLQVSLNKGLDVAKGKYIARMDADDLSLEKRFEKQFNYLEKHKDIFLVGTSAEIIDNLGNKLGVLNKFDNSRKVKRKLLVSNTMIHPSIMFRNTRDLKYREKFKCSEDYDFYLRIISSGRKITNLPDILLKYRLSNGSFVSTMPNQEFYFKKAKEFYLQRRDGGEDNEINLTPPKEKIFKHYSEKDDLKFKIFILLQAGESREVRKALLAFFRKQGLEKKLALYYVLSLLPRKFLKFLQKVF